MLEARAASHRRDSLPTGAALLLPSSFPPLALCPTRNPTTYPHLPKEHCKLVSEMATINLVEFPAVSCNNFPLCLQK